MPPSTTARLSRLQTCAGSSSSVARALSKCATLPASSSSLVFARLSRTALERGIAS